MVYSIYKITNTVNQKSYIGFTSKTVQERWRKHCHDARVGRPTFLCNAIRKHNPKAFELETLYQSQSLTEARDLAENRFIDLYKTLDPKHGYNMTKGGEGTLGHKHSAETRAKMSASHKGKTQSEATKLKLSEQRKGAGNPNFGKQFDAEYRAKISLATKGSSNPRAKRFLVTKPNGEVVEIDDRKGFCDEHNLNYSSVASSIRRGHPYRGYVFTEIKAATTPRSS